MTRDVNEPYFASGTGDLTTLIPCVVCGTRTFRRRWTVALHVGCEPRYQPPTHPGTQP
ncbi:hypothetical protein [Parafrankia sp. FMc2]|uniref:hypothetical protein n=1 Tax=Parafrankia sp. FMc2 TaxID=3233196 RepID=UPI0034D65AC8